MSIIKSHIQTTHTYNESVTNDMAQDIINKYYKRFKELETTLEKFALDNN